jgi:O-antigen/teichoic acid export membrane protein
MAQVDNAAQSSPDAHEGPDTLDTPQAGPLALRGGLLRLGGYGGVILLGLIAVPLLARHLHRIGYGNYTLAITIATIAVGLTEGGVNVVTLREYTTRIGDERTSALANMLGIRLLLSAVSVIVAVGFAAVAGYAADIVLATALAAIGLTMQVLQGVFAAPLQGTLRFGWVAGADLLRQAVATMLVVALVIAGAHLVALVAVLIPASLAALVLTIVLVRREMPLRPRLDLSISLPLLRDTLPFAIAIALSVTYFRLTVVLVSLIAGGEQLGIFSYSYRVVEVLIGLPVLVVGAAYPILTRAARDDPDRFAYTVGRMFELAVILGVWIAICLELGASFVVAVIGGHAAEPAGAVLRIQGLAVIGTFVATALAFPLLALRGYRAIMWANAWGLLATVILGLALIPVLGARGGALATVGGELALVIVNATALLRARSGLRLSLAAVPVAALAGGAAVAIGHLTGVQAILQVLIGSAVYAVVLALFGHFPPEVAHALRPHRAHG